MATTQQHPSMAVDELPRYDAPPVVETALSLQFSRLPGFKTAMAGWFWKDYLATSPGGQSWATIADAPRLEDEIEKFGEPERFGRLGLTMKALEPYRTQIIKDGDERMLQVQDSRFVLNWRKREGAYPSFETLIEEFDRLYPIFERFCRDAGMGDLELNQWEMTYVNQIPKGTMWQSTRDWASIIPVAAFPPGAPGMTGETMNPDWRFSLAGERGRLYVETRHAQRKPSGDEVLQLSLTARGAIILEKGWTKSSGFGIGHEAIVRTFTAMTTAEAHRHWKRRV